MRLRQLRDSLQLPPTKYRWTAPSMHFSPFTFSASLGVASTPHYWNNLIDIYTALQMIKGMQVRASERAMALFNSVRQHSSIPLVYILPLSSVKEFLSYISFSSS